MQGVRSHWFAVVVSTLVCCSQNYGQRTFTPKTVTTLTAGGLEVAVTGVRSGGQSTDFGVDVIIKNIGSVPTEFDSAELTATDIKSGLTYFSVAKDTGSVAVPSYMGEVLLRRTLDPGQSTQGSVWIRTAPGQAVATNLRISFKGQNLDYVAR